MLTRLFYDLYDYIWVEFICLFLLLAVLLYFCCFITVRPMWLVLKHSDICAVWKSTVRDFRPNEECDIRFLKTKPTVYFMLHLVAYL